MKAEIGNRNEENVKMKAIWRRNTLIGVAWRNRVSRRNIQ
jgi:hypothetical protein